MADNDRTVDGREVERFAALAERWWDAAGPMAPLHKLNPLRIAFVRDTLGARMGRDIEAPRPLAGLSLLDIGCGGGLLSEPMARLGARVTGIDAAARNVAAARLHAAEVGLDIAYRDSSIEALAAEGARFDVVLAMEVVEHVADLPAFVAESCACLAPRGVMFVATLNRTLKAFALAIVGAEYVLGWLPRGTHDWSKFVRPAELIALLMENGVVVDKVAGVAYDPLSGLWRTGRNLGVNYMVVASRPET
jgi:2-polyprenyl-6-hydroxyphenyl methylase/3-demethylubiquinone-9 3-methyltransferase